MFGLKKKKAAPKKKATKKTKKKVEKPKKEDLDDLEERMEAGAIRAIITFEVVGKPKKHIEDTLKQYLENLKKDARIEVLSEDHAEALEQDDGMFSTFCEAEMIINSFNVLIWIAINFSPASVEILEPAQKTLSAAQLNAWLNDLISRMHEMGIEYRSTLQKNKVLNVSMNALINNALISATEIEERSPAELQKIIGIHKDQLQPFLDKLVEKGRLTHKKGKYKTA